MKKIGIIIGTTRENRVSLSVGQWVCQQAQGRDITYDIIDLKEINLPLLDEPYPAQANQYQHQHTKNWANLINGYAAFIIVTAEYNHGYPASLKNALDYLYQEWSNKPVAFVSYGYSSKGASAIEQLLPVVANLKMQPMNSSLSISLATDYQDGKVQDNELFKQTMKQIFVEVESALDQVSS